jgi:hypothetical protein
MHTTHTTQIFTTFGGYVPEQHESEKHWEFAPRDADYLVASLTVSMIDEMMASLRSALSLR